MEVDGQIVFFNEAEAVGDLNAPEPDDLEFRDQRRKSRQAKKLPICLDSLSTASIIT